MSTISFQLTTLISFEPTLNPLALYSQTCVWIKTSSFQSLNHFWWKFVSILFGFGSNLRSYAAVHTYILFRILFWILITSAFILNNVVFWIFISRICKWLLRRISVINIPIWSNFVAFWATGSIIGRFTVDHGVLCFLLTTGSYYILKGECNSMKY